MISRGQGLPGVAPIIQPAPGRRVRPVGEGPVTPNEIAYDGPGR